MSNDPHSPTPAGPDPDEETVVRPPADDAFAPPVAPADDWLAPDAAAAAAPESDPPFPRDPDFIAGGTAAGGSDPASESTPLDQAKALGDQAGEKAKALGDQAGEKAKALGDQAKTLSEQAKARGEQAGEQAKALTERPEVMVGLAFVGGVVTSFVLKRFGR